MEAKSYDELVDAANEARIATDDAIAIELYREALKQGGARDLEARWMLGVSLTNAEQYEEALGEFDAVLSACSEDERPGVLRDRARVLTKLKLADDAKHDIDQSLRLLEASDDKSEYGATLGFRARLRLELGDSQGALADFAQADKVLKAASNRHYELYNKLHYADALSEYGDKNTAKVVLVEAEALIPQYGGGKHSKRTEDLRAKLAALFLLVAFTGSGITSLQLPSHVSAPANQQTHQQSPG